jgi:hypothetical protein
MTKRLIKVAQVVCLLAIPIFAAFDPARAMK